MIIRFVKQFGKLPIYNSFNSSTKQLCYRSQFQFFFQNKEKERLRSQIEQLKMEISENNQNTEIVTQYFKEIIEIRKQMDRDVRDKFCIELLLDMAELARLEVNSDKPDIDEKLIEELLDDNILKKVSFHNIEWFKYPFQYKFYLVELFKSLLIPIKYYLYVDERDPKQVKEWIEEFKDSIQNVKDYRLKHFGYFEENENWQDKRQVELEYQLELLSYQEMLGQIATRQEQIQDAIKAFEEGIFVGQKALEIVDELNEEGLEEIDELGGRFRERIQEKFADLNEELGQLFIKEPEISRPYFEKAMELHLQLNGKFSASYVNNYCNVVNTYIEKEPERAEKMAVQLYEEFHLAEDQKLRLQVCQFYFGVQHILGNMKGELYEEIEKLREDQPYPSAGTEQLCLDYQLSALKYCLQKNETLTAYEHCIEAINLLNDYSEQPAQYVFLINSILEFPREKQAELLLKIDQEYMPRYYQCLLQFLLRNEYELDDQQSLQPFFEFLEEENEDTTPNYFEFVKDMTLWLGDAGLFSFVVTICRKALQKNPNKLQKDMLENIRMSALAEQMLRKDILNK